MATLTPTQQFGRTARMDIHDIARELVDALGPTLVASLAGARDRKLPHRWAQPDGPEPREAAFRRLMAGHRAWAELEAAEGPHVARQWFIGGNPMLEESTPITAIREDRHAELQHAVTAFIAGDVDE